MLGFVDGHAGCYEKSIGMVFSDSNPCDLRTARPATSIVGMANEMPLSSRGCQSAEIFTTRSRAGAPGEGPRPKTTNRIRSPAWTWPHSTRFVQRDRNRGGGGVFRICGRLRRVGRGGLPSVQPTTSMIRRLAWCGMTHLIFVMSISHRRIAFLGGGFASPATAHLKVSLPSMRR